MLSTYAHIESKSTSMYPAPPSSNWWKRTDRLRTSRRNGVGYARSSCGSTSARRPGGVSRSMNNGSSERCRGGLLTNCGERVSCPTRRTGTAMIVDYKRSLGGTSAIRFVAKGLMTGTFEGISSKGKVSEGSFLLEWKFRPRRSRGRKDPPPVEDNHPLTPSNGVYI